LLSFSQYTQSFYQINKILFTFLVEMAASSASLSVEQLQDKFASLQEQSETLNKKLAAHRSGAGPKVSASDVSAAETKLQRMLDVWAKRRRTFMNLWSEMSENIEGKQADIFEDIGVDTDEAIGESLEMYRKLLASNKKGRV
jgi:26S proteasome regulatory subunit (ATPase 3-interacting protein)